MIMIMIMVRVIMLKITVVKNVKKRSLFNRLVKLIQKAITKIKIKIVIIMDPIPIIAITKNKYLMVIAKTPLINVFRD
jgi:hypothetical protein